MKSQVFQTKILALQLFFVKQLYVCWFFLSTVLTIVLFEYDVLGNNLLTYVFFDLILSLIGRRILIAIYNSLDHQLLVEKMLKQS